MIAALLLVFGQAQYQPPAPRYAFDAAAACIILHVPADATVTINGNLTRAVGEKRYYRWSDIPDDQVRLAVVRVDSPRGSYTKTFNFCRGCWIEFYVPRALQPGPISPATPDRRPIRPPLNW